MESNLPVDCSSEPDIKCENVVTQSGIPHPYYHPGYEHAAYTGMTKVTSYPSLGEDTVISFSHDRIQFSVLIEAQRADTNWEVELWHNFQGGNTWEALRLEQCRNAMLEIIQTTDNAVHCWYTGDIVGRPSFSGPVSFTIRYRPRGESEFVWVRDKSGIEDGRLLYQPNLSESKDSLSMSTLFSNISSELHVEKVRSDTPDTCLWSISGSAVPAESDRAGYTTLELGKPLDFTRWFALTRISGPWLGPRHGKGLPLAENDAILYSFLRLDGLHIVVLAISGIGDVVTLLQQQGEALAMHIQNDSDEQCTARIALAIGGSFEEANAAVMYYARGLVSKLSYADTEETQAPEGAECSLNPVSDNTAVFWQQDWYDGFAYCTWNGLGSNLSEEKILQALEGLRQNGIQITNLIIDDNWQSLDYEGETSMVRGWLDFEANSQGFPHGLKHTISRIREENPSIKHVAVWHALLGYWGGISPEGSIARNYQTIRLDRSEPRFGKNFLVVDAPDVGRFYNDFYSFLSHAGIDAVKTDVQYYLETLNPTPSRRRLTSAYYTSWTISQLQYFGGRAISCMSQSPTIIFRCQLPRTMPAVTLRNSDDFFPDVRESHPWHVFCNAHNALLTSMLNVVPDWDMFQTVHEWAPFHAAARCISGGPIYVTDVPGEHDVRLIEQMTAKTTRGETVILRCSGLGWSARIFTGLEEEKLCLIGAYHGAKKTGASVLGLFNCLDTHITDVIPLTLFRGIEDDCGYVLRSHRTGHIGHVVRRGETNAVMAVCLASYGWDIATAVPVTEVITSERHDTIQVANFGLIGKMTGIAALLGARVDVEHSGRRIRISTHLKALGTLGLWISTLGLQSGLQKEDLEDNLMVTIRGQMVPWECVDLGQRNERGAMLEIDVEKAWKEMELSAGWSNEFEILAFLEVG